MIHPRESFGAKLLAALLSTVGLLLLVTFLVVRVQTARVVERETERTIQNADRLFAELNELQQQQAALLFRPFTESRRALALLDEAITAGDVAYLAEAVDYEMARAALEDVLLVFTDDEGRAVLTMVAGDRLAEGDPADVGSIARRLLDPPPDTEPLNELTAYRVVDGRMYSVRTIYVELAFRAIGTITFGLPIGPEELERIGSVGGFEACFYAEGRCVVGTPGVGEVLTGSLEAAAAGAQQVRTEVDGATYLIRAVPLTSEAGDAAAGESGTAGAALGAEEGARRVVAVAIPLDQVIEPFDTIQRALLLGGGGALLLSGLLGAALSRSLTRPIRDLVEATRKVGEGDYEAEVAVSSRDEVGALATAFNDMTRGLLLREQYRSVLDKVVSQDVAEELLKGDVELGGENRELTVLFADIRGFTPMTDGMEPQEVIGLLNDCMEHLSRAIDAEGGVVDKFIGDEVMAVFGAPAHQPDHATRAVRAALGMRSGIATMNEERIARGDAPLGVGIGISSGVAVAGNMGSADRLNYTVLGGTVNLAARLVDQAKAGEILVSEETHRQAGDGFVTSCLNAVELKGFSAERDVYVVEGASDAVV